MMCLVVTVSAIIAMTYVSVLYAVVFPSYEYYFHTFIGMFHFVILNMLLGMVVYSYRKVVKTGPGKVPARWAPDGFTEEELEEAKQCSSSEKYRKRFYDHHIVRFCRKCNSFKPPRSHHCSECDVCVPKMDHHCPWVNNCVGNNNHKLFILFLFWGVIGISYGMISLLSRLIYLLLDVINEREITVTPIQGVVIAVNVCILVPIILGMTSLFFWQLNLALTNTTTIEYHEKRWAIKEAKKKNIKYKWPYDFGPRENLKLFFGKSYLHWFLPFPSEYLSDGIFYPSSTEMKKLSLFDEDYEKEKEKKENEENEVIFDV